MTTVPPSSPAPFPPPCIAIFVATVWEFAAVRAAFPGGSGETLHGRSLYRAQARASECWIVQTGVGPEKARAAARDVFGMRTFSLAVSSGFACALAPATVGDILIGTKAAAIESEATDTLGYVEVTGRERDRWSAAFSMDKPGSRTIDGDFISLDRIVYRAADKVALAQRTQALGLDMESAALAHEAEAAQVPFLIVRSVSDLLMEELPLDFNLFLRPTGWLKGLCLLLAHPSSLLGINRLRRQSAVAATALTMCFQVAFSDRFGTRQDLPPTMTR